jgi:hypothetical protein
MGGAQQTIVMTGNNAMMQAIKSAAALSQQEAQ